ncbi:predicted protein [Naegleria gruberi]|uniref:Predicted protein n=1 Tax=Naegleria gruberi TaxID=5762 RepID=D2VXR1_NAEGR|nr:uncharacterized protein NAEGRDRAFT_73838 [Naegleria gruberi]EFC38337.1 predicted protein [Naegleria gruberi]|eukprot:XP_002671081.1 predicted protein [Naegleria gruberi strain NEG-M]
MEKSQFKKILSGNCDESSLSLLIGLLYRHFNSKVVLLIDEYETPVLAHINSTFSKEVLDLFFGMFIFLKNDEFILEKIQTVLFSGVILLKDKGYLSGMNNLVAYSLDKDNYFSEDFGVTENELCQFLTTLRHGEDVSLELTKLKSWYNGYDVNNTPKFLFNVWSLSCYFSFGRTDYYWIKTGSIDELAMLINSSCVDVIGDLELLINGKEIRKKFSSSVDYKALSLECSREKTSLFWQMMYYAGYLTGSNSKTKLFHLEQPNENDDDVIRLRIPNFEVKSAVCELMERLQRHPNLILNETVFIVLTFKGATHAIYQTIELTNYYKWINCFEEELECKGVDEKYSIKYYFPKLEQYCSFTKSACKTVFPTFTNKEFKFVIENKMETDK